MHGFFARISRDGTVAVSDGAVVTFYRLRDHKLVQLGRFEPTSKEARELAFSSDGKQVAVITWNFTISIVDVATGQLVRTLETPTRDREIYRLEHHGVAWYGDTVAAGAGHGVFFLWQGHGEATPTIDVGTGENTDLVRSPVAFAADGKRIAFGTHTRDTSEEFPCLGWVDLPLRYKAGDEVVGPIKHCTVHDIAIWPGGIVWVGLLDLERNAFVLPTGARAGHALSLQHAGGASYELRSASVTRDGKRIVVSDDEGRVWIDDLVTGKHVRELRAATHGPAWDVVTMDADVLVAHGEGTDSVIDVIPL